MWARVPMPDRWNFPGWRGGLKIGLERVLDQKHRIERGFPSIFDHYRHHSYTGDG
jgi:hypothetical protein